MARHSQTIREIREEHPTHAAFMLGNVKAQAMKLCGCNKVKCELCGLSRLLERARLIEHHSKIAIGYLTGGIENKDMR
jgi:hypothetical protein